MWRAARRCTLLLMTRWTTHDSKVCLPRTEHSSATRIPQSAIRIAPELSARLQTPMRWAVVCNANVPEMRWKTWRVPRVGRASAQIEPHTQRVACTDARAGSKLTVCLQHEALVLHVLRDVECHLVGARLGLSCETGDAPTVTRRDNRNTTRSCAPKMRQNAPKQNPSTRCTTRMCSVGPVIRNQ